jgi:phospholipase C
MAAARVAIMRPLVLAVLGTLTAGAVLAIGCGGGGGAAGSGGNDGGGLGDSTVPPDGAEVEGGGNDGGVPEGGGPHTAKLPIKNVVFFIKENRTFDIYFGKFPGANGADAGVTCDGTRGTLLCSPTTTAG